MATKFGRNKIKCDRYKSSGKRSSNKISKLFRHIKKYPNDKNAQSVLDKLT